MVARGLNSTSAIRDPLTGTYSRAYLLEQLQQESERSTRYHEPFALLLVDLDRMGEINTTWGRSRGDRLLLEFVRRLRGTIRRSDLVFRYGGDAFAILLPKATIEHALVVAHHMLEQCGTPPSADETVPGLTLSLGLACFPAEATTWEALLRRAELRLLAAKRLGRNRVIAVDAPPPPYRLPADPPLIERDQALDTLHHFLGALPEKRRGVLVVVGAPGSGRSRFLTEVSMEAGARGYGVLALQPQRELRDKPYAALAEAWNRCTGRSLSAWGNGGLRQAAQDLLHQEDWRGLIISVDDPGYLDRPTLELLGQFLADPPAPMLALVYGTDPAAVGRLPLEAPLCSSVELPPLSPQGVRSMVRGLLSWDAPDDLVAWLHQESAGLPAYLHRGLLYLLEHGVLQPDQDGWVLARDFGPIPLGEKLGVSRRPLHCNLPVVLTSFVGREDETAQIRALLPANRLLTLVGPGGIGKTRLALQVAAESLADFADGVCFVPLAPVTSPDLLPPAVVAALGITFYGGGEARSQLLDYLQEKNLLLVLDSFDHLIEQADLVVGILQAAPAMRVLVTSRERLGLSGEMTLEIGGLHCPQPEQAAPELCDAARLFYERASRTRAGFAPSDEDRPWVAQICRLLEGMPLGIELAASWVGLLSCREIAHELERGLDFQAMPLHELPERHRSLRAVFDPSWNLLNQQERRAFVRLAVFRGGFCRQAAEQIAGATRSILSALVDKSLLRTTLSGRYEMPEVVRQYAEEKLLSVPLARGRTLDLHSRYYAGFMQQWEEALEGRQQKQALQAIAAEIENVRVAWDWAVERGTEEELERFLGSLALFYEMRGWFEDGERAFSRAAERLRLSQGVERRKSALLGRILARQGRFISRLGRHAQARALLEEGLAVLRQYRAEREIAIALNDLGDVAFYMGEYDQAHACYAESLAIARRIGERRVVARSLNYLGAVAYHRGEYAAARDLFQESLRLSQEVDNLHGIARALNGLGSVAYTLGDYEQARQAYQGSLAQCRELGDLYGVSRALNNLGAVAYLLGEHDRARQLHQECLALKREIGDRRGVAFALSNLGYVAYLQEDYTAARRLFQESQAVFGEVGDQPGLASTLDSLGHTMLALGREREAQRYFEQALQKAREIRAVPVVLDVLVGVAALQARAGRSEQGTELLGMVLAHPAGTQETRDRAGRLWAEITAALPPEVAEAARERGAGKGLEEVLEVGGWKLGGGEQSTGNRPEG